MNDFLDELNTMIYDKSMLDPVLMASHQYRGPIRELGAWIAFQGQFFSYPQGKRSLRAKVLRLYDNKTDGDIIEHLIRMVRERKLLVKVCFKIYCDGLPLIAKARGNRGIQTLNLRQFASFERLHELIRIGLSNLKRRPKDADQVTFNCILWGWNKRMPTKDCRFTLQIEEQNGMGVLSISYALPL